MKRLHGIRSIASLVLLTIGVAGCATDELASEAASVETAPIIVNSTCPVMGSPVDPEVTTASYNGMAVGFCCEGCVDGWAAMADDEKDAFLAGL